MSVSVTVKNNFPTYQAKSHAASRVAIQQMAADILRLGKLRAPYDPGSKGGGQHLVSTGKIKQLGADSMAVSFGDGLPYGRWWEFNQTHPRYGTPVKFQAGRQTRYLRSSAEEIAPRANTYFATALQ